MQTKADEGGGPVFQRWIDHAGDRILASSRCLPGLGGGMPFIARIEDPDHIGYPLRSKSGRVATTLTTWIPSKSRPTMITG